jgi:hypothetical protein
MRSDGLVETTDLSIAAWWKMHGLVVVRARRKRGGQFDFLFRDPNGEARQLAIDFANSGAQRFDQSVRSLKKLCSVGE